ncbi:MAG: hypothetical protein K2P45_06190 [Eubacterium sp.]|nr:hypothetical protein [Eubacterium sp.]
MKQIKRILALLGVALLVILYLATLLCAFFDTSSTMVLFRISVTCTVLLPILLWGYTVIYRLAKGRHEKELEEALRQMEAEKGKGKQEP